MLDYFKTAAYWTKAARHPKVELDQVATSNFLIPTDVHRSVRLRQMSYLENILRQYKSRPSVLDLGCGPATWAIQLSHLVDSWLGLDIAPSFVEHAQTEADKLGLSHLQFRTGNFLEVNEGRRFDVVVLGGTLGYINDQDLLPLANKIHDHLVPDGVVYVRVSTIPGIYPRITWRGEYQINYRKPAEYTRVFREAGFSVAWERDYAFTEGILATFYTAMARWFGKTGMTAYRMAMRLQPLTFGLARHIMDLTPLPQSSLFVLRPLPRS